MGNLFKKKVSLRDKDFNAINFKNITYECTMEHRDENEKIDLIINENNLIMNIDSFNRYKILYKNIEDIYSQDKMISIGVTDYYYTFNLKFNFIEDAKKVYDYLVTKENI
jgi:hypothetical protein